MYPDVVIGTRRRPCPQGDRRFPLGVDAYRVPALAEVHFVPPIVAPEYIHQRHSYRSDQVPHATGVVIEEIEQVPRLALTVDVDHQSGLSRGLLGHELLFRCCKLLGGQNALIMQSGELPKLVSQ